MECPFLADFCILKPPWLFIFKKTEFQQTPKFGIFQNALYLTLASSTNLVMKAAQIETWLYL